MSLPGYSRARIAEISSGCGVGVAVGTGMGVDVRVAVCEGRDNAVAVGATVGVDGEALAVVPQALRRSVAMVNVNQ